MVSLVHVITYLHLRHETPTPDERTERSYTTAPESLVAVASARNLASVISPRVSEIRYQAFVARMLQSPMRRVQSRRITSPLER